MYDLGRPAFGLYGKTTLTGAIALFYCLYTSVNAFAGDYETGLEAYNAGFYKQAKETWTIIALQGNQNAQARLGEMYEHGVGVDKDLVEAHLWYSVALDNGLSAAESALHRVETQMTDEEILDAQLLLAEFAPIYTGIDDAATDTTAVENEKSASNVIVTRGESSPDASVSNKSSDDVADDLPSTESEASTETPTAAIVSPLPIETATTRSTDDEPVSDARDAEVPQAPETTVGSLSTTDANAASVDNTQESDDAESQSIDEVAPNVETDSTREIDRAITVVTNEQIESGSAENLAVIDGAVDSVDTPELDGGDASDTDASIENEITTVSVQTARRADAG